jgi:hypothetical protein
LYPRFLSAPYRLRHRFSPRFGCCHFFTVRVYDYLNPPQKVVRDAGDDEALLDFVLVGKAR